MTPGNWARPFFEGRRVLVTGGAAGIGGAIAAGFAAAGAEVMATAVSDAEIAACPPPPGVRLERLDVRDAAAVARLVGGLPGLDVVVNCAGTIRRGEELDPEVFAQVLDVNLTGSMRVCAAARPLLARAGGGAIVNTASMLSFFGGGLVPGYAASKGGVVQLTKSLAIAFAADGIRVNAVAPGWIETPMTAVPRANATRTAELIGRTPMGRWGRPTDLIGPVLFLCSPAAGFITGVVLPVDGGFLVV